MKVKSFNILNLTAKRSYSEAVLQHAMRSFSAAVCLLLAEGCYSQLLYEVSGNSAKAKSYIFATNRYVDESVFQPQAVFQSEGRSYSAAVFQLAVRSFSQCERVVTEFAFQDYEAIAVLRQSALLPDSISASQPLSLSTLFSPADYEYIKDACELLLGLNIDSLGLLKPSYLTALYRDELMRRQLGINEDYAISTYFERLTAQRSNSDSGLSAEGGLSAQRSSLIGLDNASETMYIAFDREPLAWQCRELKAVIDYPEKEVAQERAIRELYLQGRLNDIAYLIARPDNETSVSYSDYKVFCQRNKQWVKRLTPYFKTGRTFVTLNAIYLGGDEGLLAQLRAAGFRVKAVKKKK